MKYIAAIFIFWMGLETSFRLGQYMPNEIVVTRFQQEAYQKGRQDAMKAVNLKQECVRWWTGTDLVEAKRRLCTK